MDIMSSDNIDAVLCDIGLPDGSGYEVAAQARAKGNIKAIALTGFGTEQDVQRSKEAGFDFTWSSPLTSRSCKRFLTSQSRSFGEQTETDYGRSLTSIRAKLIA